MSPAATACAAKCTACWLEPHMRFNETPGTFTGNPESSTASRAGLAPCSPASVTVPSITSSIFCGSICDRLMSPSSACASNLSGRCSRSAPPRLPNGVRTASIITDSYIPPDKRVNTKGHEGTRREHDGHEGKQQTGPAKNLVSLCSNLTRHLRRVRHLQQSKMLIVQSPLDFRSLIVYCISPLLRVPFFPFLRDPSC